MTLSELIDRLGGTLVQGDPEWMVDGVNQSERANPFDIVFGDTPAGVLEALGSKAGVVVLRPGIAGSYPRGRCIVEYDNPRLWFAKAGKLLAPPIPPSGVHPKAVVSPDTILGVGVSVEACAVIESGVRIGANTRVEAGAVIGHGVQVGEKCRIFPRAVIYPGTTIGDRVLVHAGAVLGSDGFGYVRDAASGAYTQFPQQGTLVIEDDVEIGANTTIDRGAIEDTVIEEGVKLDNLIHIAHNVRIGAHTAIAALTGVSGSTTIGKRCMIGGAIGFAGHISIADDVLITGCSAVSHSITSAGVYSGTLPFEEVHTWRRLVARFKRSALLEARVRKLERAAGVTPAQEEDHD